MECFSIRGLILADFPINNVLVITKALLCHVVHKTPKNYGLVFNESCEIKKGSLVASFFLNFFKKTKATPCLFLTHYIVLA